MRNIIDYWNTVFFFPVILFLRHGLLLAKDGALFDFAQWRRGCVFLWGRNGLLRKGLTHDNITTQIIITNLIAITASIIESYGTI